MEGSLKNEALLPTNPESKDLYVCTRCGTTLFDAAKKFNAGCGFPSFWMHSENNVKQNFLQTYGRTRTQLLCNNCGAHLGHLFNHRHTPTGLRYCINETAIVLKEL
jgi:peptide-methionine (R)-S-oxide reductase